MTQKEKLAIALCPKTKEELRNEPTCFLTNTEGRGTNFPMSLALLTELLTKEQVMQIVDDLTEHYATNLPKRYVEKHSSK